MVAALIANLSKSGAAKAAQTAQAATKVAARPISSAKLAQEALALTSKLPRPGWALSLEGYQALPSASRDALDMLYKLENYAKNKTLSLKLNKEFSAAYPGHSLWATQLDEVRPSEWIKQVSKLEGQHGKKFSSMLADGAKAAKNQNDQAVLKKLATNMRGDFTQNPGFQALAQLERRQAPKPTPMSAADKQRIAEETAHRQAAYERAQAQLATSQRRPSGGFSGERGAYYEDQQIGRQQAEIWAKAYVGSRKTAAPPAPRPAKAEPAPKYRYDFAQAQYDSNVQKYGRAAADELKARGDGFFGVSGG